MLATASGSLPGTDFRAALAAMLEMFPVLAPLPEMPARGAGSEMIGRAAALLVDMPVELGPHGWLLADHPGRDQRRAVSQWRSDLDDLEELAQGFSGTLKIAVCGPLTLSAALGRPRADVALADAGALRDLEQSLNLGMSRLIEDIRRRLPAVDLISQVDEPMLPMILAGSVPTESGYRRLPSMESSDAAATLRSLAHGAILHCCMGADWLPVAADAGFAAVHVDLTELPCAYDEPLHGALQRGLGVIAGIAKTSSIDRPESTDTMVDRMRKILDRYGESAQVDGNIFVMSPACGLGRWNLQQSRRLLRSMVRSAELMNGEVSSSEAHWCKNGSMLGGQQ